MKLRPLFNLEDQASLASAICFEQPMLRYEALNERFKTADAIMASASYTNRCIKFFLRGNFLNRDYGT